MLEFEETGTPIEGDLVLLQVRKRRLMCWLAHSYHKGSVALYAMKLNHYSS